MTMTMSILSARAATNNQPKIGGKIRSGIKLLTNAARKDPTAFRLYEEGVIQMKKYSEIEKAITDATGIKYPMYPRNTQYFNIAASDFGMPEIAALLLEQFGEVRDASSKPQLYRFPIVFHSDSLDQILPNKLIRHGGKPGYESVYLKDGQRYCQYLPEVTTAMFAEQKAKRIKRVPRREKVVRGLCDPGQCQEYLSGECKFSGRLRFYIPGIPTGLVELGTSSEYAAEGIWSELNRISEAFGEIPRTNPKRPGSYLYYLTKALENRTYFDEDGVQKTGLQWVPKLEADLDIGGLLLSGMAPKARLASTPVAWLEAPKGLPGAKLVNDSMPAGAISPTKSLDPLDQLSELCQKMDLDDALVADYFQIKLSSDWHDSDSLVLKGVEMLSVLSRKGNISAKLMIQIAIKLNEHRISTPQFMGYAERKYKKGYQNNPEMLALLYEELAQLDHMNSSEASYFKAQFNEVPAEASA